MTTEEHLSTFLPEFLSIVNVSPYRYTIIADGSGSTWGKPCGFGCLILEGNNILKYLGGNFTNGTNNFVELFPFIFALNYIDSTNHISLLDGRGKVLCVSDSQITVNCGNRNFSRNTNKFLWNLLDNFENAGYSLSFQWQPRGFCELHKLIDLLSKKERKLEC